MFVSGTKEKELCGEDQPDAGQTHFRGLPGADAGPPAQPVAGGRGGGVPRLPRRGLPHRAGPPRGQLPIRDERMEPAQIRRNARRAPSCPLPLAGQTKWL